MGATVKEEAIYEPVVLQKVVPQKPQPSKPVAVIDLSSSSSDSESEDDGAMGSKRGLSGGKVEGLSSKKRRSEEDGSGVALPLGFLDPLPPEDDLPMPQPISVARPMSQGIQRCRQFWKAGDFEGDAVVSDPSTSFSAGMEHVRVHPRFLHSNATSHKWALGAFAELMDNALDEICHGATFVNINVLENKKDGTKMLLVEDNGGGMNPDKMRQCMSLGYSAKSKVANTIGQYGNGFKTSTMRLGADVIVFSRCHGIGAESPTQSIGMLSYTFLTSTGKEDIVVPMVDYEKEGSNWNKLMRSSCADWNKNLETITQWSPYASETELLLQFRSMTDQGTRIVIYNLWEDDQGTLELDFNTHKQDIQLGGVNRDEKKIQMAAQFPNSRHFLTYQHSLRSYASILYLRLPSKFRMILRGKEIQHHNLVNDMMLRQEITYRPQHIDSDRVTKDSNLVAVVTIGFVKDAKDHIDVQGFNVYHKNRLIKPFWRVWNAAGSDGRGVIAVLEANFVEPAHDKQGFERTTVLSRLEARLIQMQKQYWSTYCHRIGYAPRRNKKLVNGSEDRDSSPEEFLRTSSKLSGKGTCPSSVPLAGKSQDSAKIWSTDKYTPLSKHKSVGKTNYSPAVSVKAGGAKGMNDHLAATRETGTRSPENIGKSKHSPRSRLQEKSLTSSDSDSEYIHSKKQCANVLSNGIKDNDLLTVDQLKEENHGLRERIKKMEESMLRDLQYERDRNRSLAEKLQAAEEKLEKASKEQEALIDMFSDERCRRDREEESLRKKLKDASNTIQELLQKCRSNSTKTEK